MKITVTAEKPQDEKLAAKVTVPAKDVDAAIKKAYKDIANKYNFPGFRRGHAPRPVIDSMLGKDAAHAQATEDLVNAAEPLVLEELNLVPVGQADYGQDPALVADGADFVYDVVFGVRPECELESDDAPEINMPPEEATEAEVEAQIKQYLSYGNAEGEEAPELTDEVAKSRFGFDTVAELRDAIKEEIESDKKASLPNLKEDRVVEAMGERLKLEKVPEAYEEEIFNELGNEFLQQLQRQGITLDLYLKVRQIDPKDFIADLHEQAEERARQSLALDAVAKQLGLEVTEEDVHSEFEKAGVDDVEKAIAEWRDNGRLPAVRDSIKRTKALDWLTENAVVTIVDEAAEAAAAAESAEEVAEAVEEVAAAEEAPAEAPASEEAPAAEPEAAEPKAAETPADEQ